MVYSLRGCMYPAPLLQQLFPSLGKLQNIFALISSYYFPERIFLKYNLKFSSISYYTSHLHLRSSNVSVASASQLLTPAMLLGGNKELRPFIFLQLPNIQNRVFLQSMLNGSNLQWVKHDTAKSIAISRAYFLLSRKDTSLQFVGLNVFFRAVQVRR